MPSNVILQEHTLLPSTIDGAIWRYSRPDHKPAHFHGQLEFLLVLRGTAVERIGQTEVTVHAGQLVWHLPGVAHEMVAVSADLDLRVVQLEPDLALAGHPPATSSVKLLTQSSEHAFSRWVGALGALAAGRAVVELKRRDQLLLLEDCDLASIDQAVSRGAHAARLRRLFANALTATRTDHDDRRAPSVAELACSELLEAPELSRTELCQKLDISEGYLSRRFRAELGISLLEQRTRLRLIHFVTQVVRSRRSMLDAALLSGFGSYSQLHRAFVQRVGLTPRDYLRRSGRNRMDQISRETMLYTGHKMRRLDSP